MIAKVRVVLKNGNIGSLARSEAMYKVLTPLAERIRRSAGKGMATKRLNAGRRARVIVFTKTRDAKKAEAELRVLTRAIGGN